MLLTRQQLEDLRESDPGMYREYMSGKIRVISPEDAFERPKEIEWIPETGGLTKTMYERNVQRCYLRPITR